MYGATVLADSALSDAASKSVQVIEALAVFLGVLIVVFFLVGRITGRFQKAATNIVFLGPALVLLTIGLVIPAIRTFYLGLKGPEPTNAKFVGVKNYIWAFTSDQIHTVLINTLEWIIVAPLVTTGLGLAIALLVDRMRTQAFYKSLIFMPMAISFVGASIIWKYVYNYRDPSLPQIGLLSQVVMSPNWLRSHPLGELVLTLISPLVAPLGRLDSALGWNHPQDWLLAHPLNNFLLMIIMVWVQTGFAMVVLSAAIKAIPDDIIEAATVDGAKGANLLFRVKLPMIRNTLIVVLTTVMITTLKVFDIVRTVTGGNFDTQVLANEMYSQSFVQFNVGRGSALAVILFVAVLPLVIYNIIQLRRERATR